MDYATVLLHANKGRHRDVIWRYALRLAHAHGAHVAAIHQRRAEDPGADGTVSPQARSNAVDTQLAAEFETLAARYADVPHRWRYERGGMVEVIARHGLYSDLIVMGQFDPADRASRGTYEAPVEIALMCGRPVLVLPHADRCADVGRRVVLAWNASPQAARMLNAAMPLLVKARTVDVVIVNEDVAPRVDAKTPPAHGHDIACYLARHRVDASVTTVAAGVLEVSEVLLSMVAEKAADLLCMGAYGHPKWHETAVGKTSAALMRRMMVPTLVAC